MELKNAECMNYYKKKKSGELLQIQGNLIFKEKSRTCRVFKMNSYIPYILGVIISIC